MNSQLTSFHFYLSPAELHWLAGAFGLTRLPLADDRSRDLPASKLEIELQAALASLQTRGLIINSGGVRWQVDHVPAALIRWLGDARRMIIVEISTKTK